MIMRENMTYSAKPDHIEPILRFVSLVMVGLGFAVCAAAKAFIRALNPAIANRSIYSIPGLFTQRVCAPSTLAASTAQLLGAFNVFGTPTTAVIPVVIGILRTAAVVGGVKFLAMKRKVAPHIFPLVFATGRHLCAQL